MDNRTDGRSTYLVGEGDTRDWFERQWRAWPERVDQRLTTNIQFLYGAVLAFRAEHNREPELSASLAYHVRSHDRLS